MASNDIRPTRNRTGSASRHDKQYGKYIALALAAAVLGATPAFATDSTTTTTKHHHHHRAAQSTQQLHMEVRDEGDQDRLTPPKMDAAREAAIRECSQAAAKYNFSTWQTTQFATYGTCMTQHGQMP